MTEFLDGYLEPAVFHAASGRGPVCACSIRSGSCARRSACHSVHFSENLDVPDGLVSRILAETTGVAGAAAAESRGAGVWRRLQLVFGFGLRPAASQRFATAALIVLTMYGVVAANGRSLAPAALFEDAARLSSRVYSRSSEFASETSGVLAEVDRIRSRVDEIFSDSEQKTPEPRRPAAGKGQGA